MKKTEFFHSGKFPLSDLVQNFNFCDGLHSLYQAGQILTVEGYTWQLVYSGKNPASDYRDPGFNSLQIHEKKKNIVVGLHFVTLKLKFGRKSSEYKNA